MFGGGEAVGVAKGKDDFDSVSLIFIIFLPKWKNHAQSKIMRDVLCQIKRRLIYFLSFQELVANAGSDRNWKGMFIATLVILAVFGLIMLSVIWLTPPEKTGIVGDTISFDDFLNRRLLGESFNGTWISGSNFSYIL